MKQEKGIVEKEIARPDGVIHKTQIVTILHETAMSYAVELDGKVFHNIPKHCVRKLDPKIT